MSRENKIRTIIDKVEISSKLKLVSGLHIGASGDFSPIGAVDSVVIRDPITNIPIIPGSSLKGKLRYLLAKCDSNDPWIKKIDDESIQIRRLFGSNKSNEIILSRLQFMDIFMSDESIKMLKNTDTDLFLSEIKFENSIDRLTCVANPRQIERVPAGTYFNFRLVYNVEDLNELNEDFETVAKALKLLMYDYLGKGGSRGNGRVAFEDFEVKALLNDKNIDTVKLKEVLSDAINK